MLIAGLQKLTLLDFPGRCAATIFTPGCNFKCPFCHNASLVRNTSTDIYAPELILDFLRERKAKLTGLVITGGEPLVQPGIAEFMADVKDIGYALKLDTNGSYPERLKEIIDAQLVDYIALDLKNSRPSYAKTTGLSDEQAERAREKINRSLELLKSSNVEFELRSTIVRELHTPEDIEEMAKTAGPVERYFLQAFKDSGDILCEGYSAWDNKTMRSFLDIARKYSPNAQLRGVD